ncbi:MAG TPA: hypothetical protein VF206_02465, partial [Rubrobacter sp.]
MGRTKRAMILLAMVLGLVVGMQVAAFAVNSTSSLVLYWGPVNVQGNQWCARVLAEIDDSPSYHGS